MGGKRKRHFVAPKSTLNRTPSPLPTQYDFVPRATTSNVPPVVLPNNNPAPSVRDYPPPRQLFPASTYPYSGSAPVPQTRAPQSSGGEATSNHQPRRRQSPSPPIEESPLSPLHGAPSPHSSQAQNSHEDPEDFAEFEDPVEPDLSEDVMDSINAMLAQPGRAGTVLSRNLEPGTTCLKIIAKASRQQECQLQPPEVQTLRNEQFWVIGGVSAHLFAVFQGFLKMLAGLDTNFTVTRKRQKI
ncbi:hypothetical protein Bca101_023544 [Brassica carinata]